MPPPQIRGNRKEVLGLELSRQKTLGPLARNSRTSLGQRSKDFWVELRSWEEDVYRFAMMGWKQLWVLVGGKVN